MSYVMIMLVRSLVGEANEGSNGSNNGIGQQGLPVTHPQCCSKKPPAAGNSYATLNLLYDCMQHSAAALACLGRHAQNLHVTHADVACSFTVS
jgi:hypothetical protein